MVNKAKPLVTAHKEEMRKAPQPQLNVFLRDVSLFILDKRFFSEVIQMQHP